MIPGATEERNRSSAQPVMDRRSPVRFRQRQPLIMRNRDEGARGNCRTTLLNPGRSSRPCMVVTKRHAEATETAEAAANRCEAWIISKSFARFAIASMSTCAGSVRISRPFLPRRERAGPHWVKLAACLGVPACKKSVTYVAQLDQFVDQPGDHSLRAAVEFQSDAFGQGEQAERWHRGYPASRSSSGVRHDNPEARKATSRLAQGFRPPSAGGLLRSASASHGPVEIGEIEGYKIVRTGLLPSCPLPCRWRSSEH